MKKIRLLLCAFVALLCMCGCTIIPEKAPVDDDRSKMAQSIAYYITSQFYTQTTDAETRDYLLSVDPEEYQEQFASMGAYIDGSALVSGLNSWVTASEELGELKEIKEVSVEHDSKGTSILVNLTVTGTNTLNDGSARTAKVEFIFDDDYYMTLTSSATNIEYTLGEKMEKAALNTLVGMGTVFIVLILLCIIIGLFEYIHVFEEKMAKKGSEAVKAAEPEVSADVPTIEESDDGELVAVISAAIAEYESANGNAVSASDFVVRSIRRRSDNKWNKA